MDTVANNYLQSIKKLFHYYKSLGDTTFEQVEENAIHWRYNKESNSIAVIVKHMAGNSLSRWSDFLHSDGEKEWRNRDAEFEDTQITKSDMIILWNKGWDCLFKAINTLTDADMLRITNIRNEGHTVIEAINRQLAHLSYHVGQIVFLAKLIAGDNWHTLSIAKGQSAKYNSNKFSAEKRDRFFTDGLK